MKIIVPMAGRGSRLRPHTLTTPKPLLKVAGKPIVQRLVENIIQVCDQKISEIAFIIGDFGEEVELQLMDIAKKLNAVGKIYYQKNPLGTAHAILCAQESLDKNCVVAFADTLFFADFKIDNSADGIIWVNKIEDPSSFGVVKLNKQNEIEGFVEKPQSFVSDLAIIGIYYFKNGRNLKDELQFLLDNNIKDKGEFQLTSALENMKKKERVFVPANVSKWMDCGNKNATVLTNKEILDKEKTIISDSSQLINSKLIDPCYIGEGVVIKNSTIGPHASIGKNTEISGSVIKNSIIQEESNLKDVNIKNSMIGNHVSFTSNKIEHELSLGDFSQIIITDEE